MFLDTMLVLLAVVIAMEGFFVLYFTGYAISLAWGHRCDVGLHSYTRVDKEYGFPAKKCSRCNKLKIKQGS